MPRRRRSELGRTKPANDRRLTLRDSRALCSLVVTSFRITYSRWSALGDDMTQQMARGGLLVRVDVALDFDAPVSLVLVLPDRTVVEGEAKVLQRLEGHGVAVTVGAELVNELRRRVATGGEEQDAEGTRHEQIDPSANIAPIVEAQRSRPSTVRPLLSLDALTQAQKIHLAMHGTRDERNAILRDQNRTLHPFVLKNPQLSAEDVLEISKNAQMSPALLKLIAERRDWVQRAPIACALVRNPKTPPNVALQALAYVPMDALRIMAKGTGVLPHIAQAARKKVIGT